MIKDIINYEGPVSEIFMVKQATRAVGTNGSPYLSMTLQDNSGTLEARMWNISDDDLQIASPGHLIRVDGLMQNYKGHPQLKVSEIEGVDERNVELSKYVPTAPVSLEKLKAKLDEFMNLIQDPELKNLTETLILENYDAYTTYPAAVTVHHAYMGGLMYHSLSICAMAIQAQKQYKQLSLDYLVSGALLHDLGKTKELSSAMAATYTSEGNLLGHISLGAMMVYEKGKALKVTPEKLDVLVHIILAHHGEYEFGSPKLPATAEAYVIHSLDDLDAKLECLRTAYNQTEEGAFTSKIIWMENTNFFKPHTLNKDKKD